MEKFTGTIIEESLEDKSVLNSVKIISTKIEEVIDRHKTPWVKTWTLHKVEVEPDQAESIAKQVSESLDRDHKHSWYADYKNSNTHYIIFRDKVFKIDRTKAEEYNDATKYGLALGIPDYQIGFTKNLKS